LSPSILSNLKLLFSLFLTDINWFGLNKQCISFLIPQFFL
jgi:hypothetical protein